jgi:hypothetical protein
MFNSENKFLEHFRKSFALVTIVLLTIKIGINYLGSYEFSSTMIASLVIALFLTFLFWRKEKDR